MGSFQDYFQVIEVVKTGPAAAAAASQRGARGGSDEETSSPSPGLSHVCEAGEGTEEALWRSRLPHLKAGLIWADVRSLSGGGGTEAPRWGRSAWPEEPE